MQHRLCQEVIAKNLAFEIPFILRKEAFLWQLESNIDEFITQFLTDKHYRNIEDLLKFIPEDLQQKLQTKLTITFKENAQLQQLCQTFPASGATAELQPEVNEITASVHLENSPISSSYHTDITDSYHTATDDSQNNIGSQYEEKLAMAETLVGSLTKNVCGSTSKASLLSRILLCTESDQPTFPNAGDWHRYYLDTVDLKHHGHLDNSDVLKVNKICGLPSENLTSTALSETEWQVSSLNRNTTSRLLNVSSFITPTKTPVEVTVQKCRKQGGYNINVSSS